MTIGIGSDRIAVPTVFLLSEAERFEREGNFGLLCKVSHQVTSGNGCAGVTRNDDEEL